MYPVPTLCFKYLQKKNVDARSMLNITYGYMDTPVCRIGVYLEQLTTLYYIIVYNHNVNSGYKVQTNKISTSTRRKKILCV